MAKTISGIAGSVCSIVAAVSLTTGLSGAIAYAQDVWNEDPALITEGAKKPPPPAPPISIVGSWVGTIQDNIKGPGTISLTLAEKVAKAKATLTGTWTVSFPDTAPRGGVNDFGTVKGSVVGSTVTVALVPKKGDAIGSCKNMIKSTEATLEKISATFGGCGHSGTIILQPGEPPTTVLINVGDDFFFPNKVTISAGQTVRWTNNGDLPHLINANPGTEKCRPVSNEAFNSPTLSPGDVLERTFNTPGTFAYHCEFHGCAMKGTITVN